jgi:capsular polysaccharide transport system permease protein
MAEEASKAAAAAEVHGDAKRLKIASLRESDALAIPETQKPAKPAPAGDEAGKVVHIVRRLQEEANRRGRKRGRPWVIISAAAAILLPTFFASLYYIFIAADQYVAETRFAIRSNEAQTIDVLGMMTGMGSTTVTSDSYIVTEYVQSREMVAELERRLPLKAMFAREEADFWTRLDPDVSREALVEYWRDRIEVFYDSTKNTVAIEVRAFTAEDAEALAREIVTTVRRLVNDLSAQARRDAVRFAATEVARAELRVRSAREAMLEFRLKNREFDPAQTATAALTLTAQLQGQMAQLNAQLAALSGYMAEDAPSMQMLKSRIGALESEIARVQSQVAPAGGAAGEALPAASPEGDAPLVSVASEYGSLLIDQEFAEKAYLAALGSLERARGEADATQSYLAVYLEPARPDSSTYPNRLRAILVVLALSATIWAVSALGFLTIKDHTG